MTIDERIKEALRRLKYGLGAMRIPADECDADLVLSECQTQLVRLEAERCDLERERGEMNAALREALEALAPEQVKVAQLRVALSESIAAHERVECPTYDERIAGSCSCTAPDRWRMVLRATGGEP